MAECNQDADDTLDTLRSITVCCICYETYADPRMLPCSHTYCLKCLPIIEKANILQCAICRKQFDNLSTNLEDIPRNAFVQEVLNLSQKIKHSSLGGSPADNTLDKDNGGTDSAQNLGRPADGLKGNDMENEEPNSLNNQNNQDKSPVNLTETNKLQGHTVKHENGETSVRAYIPCDICADESEIVIRAATVHCIDCEQNQCDTCSKDHKKQTLLKGHCILVLTESLTEKLGKAKKEKEPDTCKILCEVCAADTEVSAMSDIPTATKHCTTCSESQCDECSHSHMKQKQFKSHQIVVIDDNVKKDLLKKNWLIKVNEMNIFCDICKENCSSENDCEIKTATLRCIDCCENQCSDCSREHKKQRLFKRHQIVEIDQKMKETILKEMFLVCDVCAENNDNGISDLAIATQHCIDCTENQCDQCSKEHKRQRAFKNHNTVPLDDEMKQRLKQLKETEDVREQTPPNDQCMNNTDHSTSSDSLPSKNMTSYSDCRKDKGVETAPTTPGKIDQKENPVKDSLRLDLYAREPQSLTSRSEKSDLHTIQLRMMDFKPLLEDNVFARIRQVIQKPSVNEEELANFWKSTMPYIVQRLKMWNGDVITAQNLASLVNLSQKGTAFHYAVSPLSWTTAVTPKNEMSTNSISRLDCLTYIVNAADFVVAQDILRILGKFPIAIPLVVQNINDENKFIATKSLIQNNVVKWESTPGEIAENYLFSSPFRLIVAVRIGTASKSGKSTILNQLLRRKFVFSSKFEAGSRYGRPRTLDGSVEIVCLTQETCCDITWKSIMLDFYRGNMEEVAILANLHGDVFQYPDTLKYLTGLACSFIVFLMPDFSMKQWLWLKHLISGKISVHLLVDPKDTRSDELFFKTICTDSLSSDDTHETMRSILKESINIEFSRKQPFAGQVHDIDGCLQSIKTTDCTEAEKIIKIVSQIGCLKMRHILQNATVDEPRMWCNDVKRLIQLFLAILHLNKKESKESIMFLETHLSRLSAIESANSRAEVSKANDRLRRFVQAPPNSIEYENASETKNTTELKEAQEKLKLAAENVDNMNLGQEHFFRVLSNIYEKSIIQEDIKDEIPSVTDLPSCFAELLINGHAIEVLNGDSGQTQLIWVKAICESVCKKLPNLKVFVISIIGLQSSGKSTLLNALFSCRFAVSVGRCSRGLFMRMIFLDEDLRKTLGCECVILIDSEGLCSPEKMNDPKASHKDRLMATFAMGVSNLVIVNILGEGMTEMTEILQIAIVAMARLRSGGIKPDILMVQHLQERNVSKVDQAKGQFCEAINKAFGLIHKNDIEIGSASAECLAELTARIQSGDLFQHFGPFKDGSSVSAPPAESYHEDVVSLFETLVTRMKAFEKKFSFELWSHHFESYWTCVEEENFALNFKNVTHITDFLFFEKKIAKVKELLDCAFRKHSNTFAIEIKEAISLYVSENKKAGLKYQEIFKGKQQQLQTIPFACPQSCDACKHYRDSHDSLLQSMSGTEWEDNTMNSLRIYHGTLKQRTENMLRQIFHGSVVRQGCFSEFSDAITRELNQALKDRPDGIYSPEEQQDIMENIWRLLQSIANSKETGDSFDDKFISALNQEYAETGKLTNVIHEFGVERNPESIFKSKADKCFRIPFLNVEVRKPWNRINDDQMKLLLNDVDHLVTRVFRNREEDYIITGLDFEDGMVRYIRTEFPNTVNGFEKRFRVGLSDHFKLDLQMYALQQFKKQMYQLQDVWNKQNRPTDILLQKKNDYMTEIKTTLEFGFTCAGEGKKVAARLGKAIEKSAISAVYNAKVDSVRNSAWTTNSEKVRLVYFEELAKEVKDGKKERALYHFRNPEHVINEWYFKKVDSLLSTDKLIETFNSARSKELTDILNKVQHSATKGDIDGIIESFITDVEDRYCCPLNPKDNDFEAYKNTIRHDISRLETERRELTLPSVANDPEVKRRLGCTKHCFWCGALCWGSPDHHFEKEGNSEMECHHSCHQPSGLKGVSDRYSRELRSVSCHNRKDTWTVWFGEFKEDEEGIKWDEAKKNHFPDWKFDVHCITKFDELMRWFFQELHEDIAKSRGKLPANSKELEENRCTNLNLDKILTVVRTKI